MPSSLPRALTTSRAAARLGVSIKALRLYERHGLLVPPRTAAGHRAYGPGELARGARIAALRATGLGLAAIRQVLDRDPGDAAAILAAHRARLGGDLHRRLRALDEVGERETGRAAGSGAPCAAFDLPWPWGGERFVLDRLARLHYIVGPLGSGKTRLARRLAEALPGGTFLGLDRLDAGSGHDSCGDKICHRKNHDLTSHASSLRARLIADGATASRALTALVAAIEGGGSRIVVVDMVEEGLDRATQEVLIAGLRRRAAAGAPPLVLMTRSSAILDLAAVGPDERVLFCPANHAPPMHVDPWPGAPGYEALATCLAPPEVRARTAGTIAWRP